MCAGPGPHMCGPAGPNMFGPEQKWTVHPPSKPVTGARPPSRGSGSVRPQRLKVTA